jgi:hypothetical protein
VPANVRLATRDGEFVNVPLAMPLQSQANNPLSQLSPTFTFSSGGFFEELFRVHATQADYDYINKPVHSGDAMADPTREEFDAKLATVEARTETRFVELSGKIDRVADSISSLANSVTTIRTEVRHENNLTRWTIVGLVVAGLAALWVTQSNMLASFSAGVALHEAIQKPPASSHQ